MSIATQMEALSLDDTRHNPSGSQTPPAQIDCSSSPPLDEYNNPEYTGAFYYGIYVPEGGLEEYAKRVNPDAVNHCRSSQFLYALDHLRWIVNNPSLNLQRAVLKPRHNHDMPFIEGTISGTIVCLFSAEKPVKKRMSAEKVKKLVDALGRQPDWFEIYFFC